MICLESYVTHFATHHTFLCQGNAILNVVIFFTVLIFQKASQLLRRTYRLVRMDFHQIFASIFSKMILFLMDPDPRTIESNQIQHYRRVSSLTSQSAFRPDVFRLVLSLIYFFSSFSIRKEHTKIVRCLLN